MKKVGYGNGKRYDESDKIEILRLCVKKTTVNLKKSFSTDLRVLNSFKEYLSNGG